jgi:hypothetical protein
MKKVKEILIIVLGCLVIGIGSYFYFSYGLTDGLKISIFNSGSKELDDYFIEKLGMSAEEAKQFAENDFSFFITKDTTLDEVVKNLHEYSLIKDKETLRRALEQTKDNLPGKSGALKVGNNTIDVNAYYQLKKGLPTQEVANILLNRPNYLQGDSYNYIFMPNDLPAENQKTPDN